MQSTRSSGNWETQPGKFDVLNLRLRFPSASAYEIPDLRPCRFVPANLAAWNAPRHRDHAASTGGALHFFLDDYRFETVWSSPERLFDRVAAVGTALTPDFSLWTSMPHAAQVWNTYRSRWVGAYWQSRGIRVIPTACWSTPDSYEFCFDGIPEDSVVALSSMGIQSDKVEQTLFREGLKQLVSRTQPRTILAYGQLRYCDDLNLPEVVEYPTFWDRRRKQVDTRWAEGDQAAEDDQQRVPVVPPVREVDLDLPA